jgi:hypothetical protein
VSSVISGWAAKSGSGSSIAASGRKNGNFTLGGASKNAFALSLDFIVMSFSVKKLKKP